jgi:hypothetical protein
MESTKKTSNKPQQTELLRSPVHVKHYVTNIRGGRTSQDFRFELMNEKIQQVGGKTTFISDALVILSPMGAKRLLQQLSVSVKEHEDEFGEIPLEVEKDLQV